MASLEVVTFVSSHTEGINTQNWSNLDCPLLASEMQ